MSELLKIMNLSAGYGKFSVINGITFSVPERSVCCVIGPNGSGKSTLLKAIMGLAHVFEGSILFNKVEITHMEPESIVRLGIGYVPQLSNIFPEMTVKENIQIGLVASKGNYEIVKESIFSLFPQLEKKLNVKAGTLSGGERQMLAISRALVSRPKLLIMDEPTAGLSPAMTQSLFEAISRVEKLGITILLVEQNVQKALQVSSKVMILVQGKKVYEGSPNEISSDEKIAEYFLGRIVA